MTTQLKLRMLRSAGVLAAGAVAAAAVAGCGAAQSQTASATSPAPAASSAPPASPAPSASPAGAAPVSSAGAVNLVASGGLKATLTAAFAAMKKLPASEVTGPQAGSLYYGEDTATGTYWATAQFGLTAAAPRQAALGMQDGGAIGIFSRRAGQAWTAKAGTIPFPCPAQLPAAMLAVWHLAASSACGMLSAQSPAAAQVTQAAGDLPAGSYFGTVVSEQVQADGTGFLVFEPETWQGTAAPVSHARLSYPVNIGPSAAASFWAGTSAESSHEVAGTFSLDYARRIQAAMAPFATQPYSGYEIKVAVPAGCTSDCAQVTSIAQIGSLTPRSPDADFTEPKS